MADALGAMVKFADAIGELGAAWGLPREACRVHAFVYLKPSGVDRPAIAEAMELSESEVEGALDFLRDYRLAWSDDGETWRAHEDPWEALLTGLDQRRGRDLPAMRREIEACRQEIARSGAAAEAKQIDKMIGLMSDLGSLQSQAFRFSPRFLRGSIGLLGRAARLFSPRSARKKER